LIQPELDPQEMEKQKKQQIIDDKLNELHREKEENKRYHPNDLNFDSSNVGLLNDLDRWN
jgi:hypothetical protein